MKINTKMRKGFTLVELLFVMAIIAILVGFAIANLKDSSNTAVLSSMKNDARNAIAAEQAFFAENQEYAIDPNYRYDDDGDGVVVIDGAKFTLSKNNRIKLSSSTCDDNSVGFEISVINTKLKDKEIVFDSCTDGYIHLVDNSQTSTTN